MRKTQEGEDSAHKKKFDIINVLIALGIAFVVVVIDGIHNGWDQLSVQDDLLITLISTIIGLLLDIRAHLHVVHESQRQLSATIHTEYVQFLRDFPDPTPKIMRDVGLAFRSLKFLLRALGHQNIEVSKLAQIQLIKNLEMLENLSKGVCTVDHQITGQSHEMIAIQHSKRNYSGVSYTTNSENYWRSKEGQELFGQNVLAISREVSVTRIFLHPFKRRSEIRDVMTNHFKAGVAVFLVDADMVNDSLYKDIGIVDDGSIAVEIMHPQIGIRRTEFYFQGPITDSSNVRIEEIKEIWDMLWNRYRRISFSEITWE